VPVVLVSAVREEMSSTSWMGVAVGSSCKARAEAKRNYLGAEGSENFREPDLIATCVAWTVSILHPARPGLTSDRQAQCRPKQARTVTICYKFGEPQVLTNIHHTSPLGLLCRVHPRPLLGTSSQPPPVWPPALTVCHCHQSAAPALPRCPAGAHTESSQEVSSPGHLPEVKQPAVHFGLLPGRALISKQGCGLATAA
jgi:hypothetical protein